MTVPTSSAPRTDCSFHPGIEAAVTCEGCSLSLCESCSDPEYDAYCYICSHSLRNGKRPQADWSAPIRGGRYVAFKLGAWLASIILCGMAFAMIMVINNLGTTWEFFIVMLFFMLYSGPVVLVLGIPASMAIDGLVKKDRGRAFLLKLLLHAAAGFLAVSVIIRLLGSWNHLFSNESLFFYGCGVANASVYYLCYKFFLYLTVGSGARQTGRQEVSR